MVRSIPSVLLVLGTGSCFCCVAAIPLRCLLVRQVRSRLFGSWSSTSLILRFRSLGRVGGSSQLYPDFNSDGSCDVLARGCDEYILLSGDPLLVAAIGFECCRLSEGTRPEGAGDSDCAGLKSSASAYPFSASISRSFFFLLRHSAEQTVPSFRHRYAFETQYSGSCSRSPCCSASSFRSITRPAWNCLRLFATIAAKSLLSWRIISGGGVSVSGVIESCR